jgi:hypothetical protein
MIAIDPGMNGGIAWLDPDGNPQCKPMPETEGDVLDLLRTLRIGTAEAKLEEVGGYVGKGQPGSSMFKFGRGFGFIVGSLMALGFRIEFLKPQKWQKFFGLGTSAQAGGKTPWKNKLKAEAQRRFPTLNVTLKTSDALLILDYGRAA